MFLQKLFILNFFLCFVIYFINLKYRYQISKKLKILDTPDNERKLHKGSTPLNGALWFVIAILLFLIESFLFENFINHQYRLIIITTLLIYIVGFIDDRKSINPNVRLFIYFFIFYLTVSLDKNFNIKLIYFESLNLEINTSIFATFFSAFCLAAFVNSINLVDGINALANSILTIILFFFFFSYEQEYFLLIILLFFLTLNSFMIYKQKFFLGDSGALAISTFAGMHLIYLYNLQYKGINNNLLSSEDIFVLMAFPGLDMIRVFFERLINGKNPFKPSREHLHHFLIKKHSLLLTLIIYISFAFTPAMSNFIFQDFYYTSYNLIACIILYIVLLKYSRNKI